MGYWKEHCLNQNNSNMDHFLRLTEIAGYQEHSSDDYLNHV